MSNVHELAGLAVLTSGGDAPGMNAAVRAVVRTALHHGVQPYAVYEGYRGLVGGGGAIRRMSSEDVAGILNQGGSVIGSARCAEFRTRDGRRAAARNLVSHGIDALVVIGGDGSLTGADLFRREWPELLAELVAAGQLDQAAAAAHPRLRLAGMVGSIDNDMFGTDMTIGADTALHRIVEALDAIHSTASSHQRSFVVEVMGRQAGYLALMSALATGANWVLIPENPPDQDNWEDAMCEALAAGRGIGRRQNMVIVAEGAQDRHGKRITSDYVREVLQTRLGEDTRVTILGHVQRGGRPSAFDRYLGTIMGHAAVEHLLDSDDDEPQVMGIREHQVICSPLMDAVRKTHRVAEHIAAHDYEAAMALRGGSFAHSFQTFRTLTRSRPGALQPGQRQLRIAVVHAGGPAPGMNTAARVAVRLGLHHGHRMLAVSNGFKGLRHGDIQELTWMSVSGWVARGGAELGTNRYVPDGPALADIAEQLQANRIDALLMIGGWAGYEAAYKLHISGDEWAAFNLPIVCLPATINNDLPGSELSVGADTALNSIVTDVDKIKQSAVASRRVFVVEVMGKDSGYLAFMSGLTTGAERVYLPEEGITLDELRDDVEWLKDGFRAGKRIGLMVRGENAEPIYTTPFLHALFSREGGDLFDAREAVLGHVQAGGDPSPFDRIHATRMAVRCIDYLITQCESDAPVSAFIGQEHGRLRFTPLAQMPALVARGVRRAVAQEWMQMRPLADVMTGRGVPG